MLQIDVTSKDPIEPGEVGEVVSANIIENEVERRQSVAVEQKKYTLNDIEALKKKMKKADLKPEISITDESKNGGSVNIDMKTSLFEYMKEMWIGDMKKIEDIKEVTPITKAQASRPHTYL